MNQAKVLVLDVETAPMLAYVWGLRDQNIALSQIKKDWYILAFAAKWLGDLPSKTIYMDQRNAKVSENDHAMLVVLWRLLNEADIVITQNGKNFDGPKINARFIMKGMTPPSPYKHLDTYQIVRRVAKFTSNKLEYLTDKLCTRYKKLKHKKFPGMSLWDACMSGNPKAWEEMKRYNIHDVLSTEELYLKIRAWAPGRTANIQEAQSLNCKVCGKGTMQSRGIRYSNGKQYKRMRCQSCGTWTKEAVK